jgi:hypothetical protein
MKKDVKKRCPHGSDFPIRLMFANRAQVQANVFPVLADSAIQRGIGFKATQQFVASSQL